jgi:hypothetical protein
MIDREIIGFVLMDPDMVLQRSLKEPVRGRVLPGQAGFIDGLCFSEKVLKVTGLLRERFLGKVLKPVVIAMISDIGRKGGIVPEDVFPVLVAPGIQLIVFFVHIHG